MKPRTKLILIFVFIAILTIGCKKQGNNSEISSNGPKNPIEDESKDNEINPIDNITEKIKAMSLEEKIGQLFIVGFEGKDINDDVISYLEDLKVSGFILFKRNIDDEYQTTQLLNNVKLANSNNDFPLFLAIDEEGGKVSRLPNSFVKLPEAMKVGNMNDSNIAYRFGKILGERVKSLGFNMNFAPVLDINSNPQNPVIGNRAFGINVENVINSGVQVMLGIEATNIIPAIKHFPGHGDTAVDSHINLPIVNKTIEELKNFELLPFKEAIDRNADMVMVAHILYPKIDNLYPATMSTKIIQGVLREDWCYEGLVVSDDMTMGAIMENYSLEEGVLSFFKAGGDIALICHGRDNPRIVIESIIKSVDEGDLPEEQIDGKVYRILKLKEKYNLKDNIIEEIDINEINSKTEKLIKEIGK